MHENLMRVPLLLETQLTRMCSATCDVSLKQFSICIAFLLSRLECLGKPELNLPLMQPVNRRRGTRGIHKLRNQEL